MVGGGGRRHAGWLRQPLFVCALCGLTLNCRGERAERAAAGIPTAARATGGTSDKPTGVTPPAVAGASGDEEGHAHSPEGPTHPPTTATVLSRKERDRLTTLRVMAHVGSVIIRKEGSAWV